MVYYETPNTTKRSIITEKINKKKLTKDLNEKDFILLKKEQKL